MARRRSTLCSLLAALSLTAISSSTLAHDKNDNHLNETLANQALETTLRVAVLRHESCSDVHFYNLDNEEECPDGAERKAVSAGSGIVLQGRLGSHYVLSAAHVIPKDGYFVVVADDKLAYVVKRDARSDLALLLVPQGEEQKKGNLTAFQGCLADNVQLGDFVVGVGYTSGMYKSFLDGRIHSIPILGYYNLSGSVNLGNSGGPVFVLDAEKLRLAGILVTTDPQIDGVGGFVGGDRLRNFLKDTAVGHYLDCNDSKK